MWLALTPRRRSPFGSLVGFTFQGAHGESHLHFSAFEGAGRFSFAEIVRKTTCKIVATQPLPTKR